MKKFLIISSSLLILALLATVVVFFIVNKEIGSTPAAPEPEVETAIVFTEPSVTVPEEGVPLRDLPLGDTQRSALETVGVDVETFVITPAMQVCAAEKLGFERMNEIVAGAAPTVLETARIAPCISAE